VPDNVVDLVPKHLQPTQSDFLMAAAIMHRQRPSGPAEGVVAKPGQTVQPVDVGGNIAKVREEFGRAAAEMTGVADAVRAARGEMTTEEAQTFALGAIPALVPGGKVAGEVAEVAPGVMRGIRAFHGSPYDFERFSMANIGTGEGAQAYGHGLYFAENPAVAAEYKRTTGGQIGTPEHYAEVFMSAHGDDREKAIADLQHVMSISEPQFNEPRQKALELLKSGFTPGLGKTYEVNINADPEHFLDWDKPLSEQSAHVQKVLGSFSDKLDPSTSGRNLYDQLGPLFLQKHGIDTGGVSSPAAVTDILKDRVTDQLRQAGIPGIKYLDQGSRAAATGLRTPTEVPGVGWRVYHTGGFNDFPTQEAAKQFYDDTARSGTFPKPTSNYVVFDDKLIDIIKKYGIAGLITANVAHFKTGAGNGNGSE
jgi:hypothetical protein